MYGNKIKVQDNYFVKLNNNKVEAGVITPTNCCYTLGVISRPNTSCVMAIDPNGRVAFLNPAKMTIQIYETLELKYSWEFELDLDLSENE